MTQREFIWFLWGALDLQDRPKEPPLKASELQIEKIKAVYYRCWIIPDKEDRSAAFVIASFVHWIHDCKCPQRLARLETAIRLTVDIILCEEKQNDDGPDEPRWD